MKNLMDKLTTYASLVGVVTAIGGGFYAWGEFNTRLSAIEGSGVDISGISKNAEDIAVINEKIGKLDLSSIAVVKKLAEDNEEWIEEIESKVGKNKEALDEFLAVTRRITECPKSHLECGRLLLSLDSRKDPVAAIYHFRRFLLSN